MKQTDWEKHKVWAKTIANMVYGFNGSDKNNPPMKGLGNATLTLEDCLADARREKWIDSDCEHLWSSTTEGQRVRICLLCNREQVLATLREEEGAVK